MPTVGQGVKYIDVHIHKSCLEIQITFLSLFSRARDEKRVSPWLIQSMRTDEYDATQNFLFSGLAWRVSKVCINCLFLLSSGHEPVSASWFLSEDGSTQSVHLSGSAGGTLRQGVGSAGTVLWPPAAVTLGEAATVACFHLHLTSQHPDLGRLPPGGPGTGKAALGDSVYS